MHILSLCLGALLGIFYVGIIGVLDEHPTVPYTPLCWCSLARQNRGTVGDSGSVPVNLPTQHVLRNNPSAPKGVWTHPSVRPGRGQEREFTLRHIHHIRVQACSGMCSWQWADLLTFFFTWGQSSWLLAGVGHLSGIGVAG